MRNRVTYQAARSARGVPRIRVVRTASVLVTLPVALPMAAAQSAAAEVTLAQGPAAADLSFGAAGPVGIAAVLVGIGGLVAGLLRRRRLAARSAATRTVSGAHATTTTSTTPPTTASTGTDRAA